MNEPYYTKKLNGLAKLSIGLQTIFILNRLMIRTFALHENSKRKTTDEIIGNLSNEPIDVELIETRRIKLQEDNSTIIYGIVYGFILIFLFVMLKFVSEMWIHFLLMLFAKDDKFNWCICGKDTKAFI